MAKNVKCFHIIILELIFYWKFYEIVSWVYESKSASSPLVGFGVLNDNLIKGIISSVKCIIRFLMNVQMYSLIYLLNYNYEENGTM
jgi:hypothetical protein